MKTVSEAITRPGYAHIVVAGGLFPGKFVIRVSVMAFQQEFSAPKRDADRQGGYVWCEREESAWVFS